MFFVITQLSTSPREGPPPPFLKRVLSNFFALCVLCQLLKPHCHNFLTEDFRIVFSTSVTIIITTLWSSHTFILTLLSEWIICPKFRHSLVQKFSYFNTVGEIDITIMNWRICTWTCTWQAHYLVPLRRELSLYFQPEGEVNVKKRFLITFIFYCVVQSHLVIYSTWQRKLFLWGLIKAFDGMRTAYIYKKNGSVTLLRSQVEN